MAFWKDKIVVVTGGSAGLGRCIVSAFAAQGATTVIVSRGASKIEDVIERSGQQSADIHGFAADVTSDESVAAVVEQIVARFGRIDVWVNNVGKSTRASVESCGVEIYRDLMEVNFYSVVRCTLAVLPHLKTTSGSVVNIGSLASKTGWANVAPYATSKHAMAAFNHQLRLEGPSNVNYLLVCPGPIQRADSADRYAAEAAGLGKSAKEPGGGVKLKGIAPEWLAAKIESYCRRRKVELVIPGYTRLLFSLSQLWPKLGDYLLNRSKKSD